MANRSFRLILIQWSRGCAEAESDTSEKGMKKGLRKVLMKGPLGFISGVLTVAHEETSRVIAQTMA